MASRRIAHGGRPFAHDSREGCRELPGRRRLRKVLQGNQPTLQRLDGGVSAVANLKLRKHVTYVCLDGLFANPQDCGDVLVRVATRDLAQDLDLARRQIVRSLNSCKVTSD